MDLVAPLLDRLPMEPWALAFGLAALTLLVEDGAVAAGVALSGAGLIDFGTALTAVALGIALGDLLLYGTGRWAQGAGPLRRRLPASDRLDRARGRLERHLISAVIVARIVPGLRLVTYTAAGVLRVPFLRFALLVSGAVAVWTGLLFVLADAAGAGLAVAFGMGPWTVAAVLFLTVGSVVLVAGRLAGRVGP